MNKEIFKWKGREAVKEILNRERNLFVDYYKNHFLLMMILFFLFSILAYFSLEWMAQSNGFLRKVANRIINTYGVGQEGFGTAMGWEVMWSLFLNNAIATGFAIFLGFIPIVILPYGVVVLNGLTVGFIVRLVSEEGLSVFKIMIFGLLPHGLTELPAFFLATGISSYISVTILKRWLIKKEPTQFPTIKTLGLMVGKTYVMVILPLLLMSAWVEAFITPRLLILFL